MTNGEEPSHKDFYEYTVRQIEREQGLINNRLSWMLTFQGFLFASIALVANKDTEPAIRLVFRNVIPAIGIAVALLALVGVHAAALSSSEIKTKWRQRDGFQDYPPTFGNRTISLSTWTELITYYLFTNPLPVKDFNPDVCVINFVSLLIRQNYKLRYTYVCSPGLVATIIWSNCRKLTIAVQYWLHTEKLGAQRVIFHSKRH